MNKGDPPPCEGEDIYEDLDFLFSTKDASKGYESDCSSCGSTRTSIPSDTWMDESDLKVLPPESNKDAPLVALCVSPAKSEAQLMTEMDLYVELLSDQVANQESKLMSDPEIKKLHNELTKLKTLLAEKDAEILDLTNQNVIQVKNICSLYITAKAEIDQKDLWLAQANERIDKYRNSKFYHFPRSQGTQTDLTNCVTAASSVPSYDKVTLLDNSKETWGHQHSPNHRHSPMSVRNTSIENEPVQKKRNLEHCNSVEPASKDSSLEIIKRKSEESVELDRKFNLLPEEIKTSFKEHEQSHIASLIKLKESLINSFLKQSIDQSHSKDISQSTDPNCIGSVGAESSEVSRLPSNIKTACVSKDIPLQSDKGDQSLLTKNLKNERAQISMENHSSERPMYVNSYTKRTDAFYDKHVHKTAHSSSMNSNRDEKYNSYRNRNHSRRRESSLSKEYPSNYVDHRRQSLYSYSRDHDHRPPYSSISRNSSASLTLYKMRKARALKRQRSISHKKNEENK